MRNSVMIFVLSAVLVLGVITPALAQDANPINILKSDAPFKDKADACRMLALKGNRDAVPVLAAMLLDEKLSHLARYALEPMPCPEAGQALRDALGKADDRLKVGIIGSLAVRHDEQAVPALIKLLSDGKPEVAQAAAKALGIIVTPDGVKALENGISQTNARAFGNALLRCAEQLAAKGQRGQAREIYDRVRKVPNAPRPILDAALRGTVLTGSAQDLRLLFDALRGDKEDTFAAALRIALEVGRQPEFTAALTGILPTLPAERKKRLIETLGERGDVAAGPAVLAEIKDGPIAVRVAAIRVLTRLGYSPALKEIEPLAWAEDTEVAKAAQNALAFFPGPDREATLKAMLDSQKVEARRLAIELIGRGGLKNPVPLLMKAAETDADESIRVIAWKALQDCAGLDEMPRLLDNLLKTRSDAKMDAVEKALSALCERQKRAFRTEGIVIQKAVYGNLPDGPSADVTAKVSRSVAAGSHTVDASNANFGDTAPNTVKNLRVDYLENGTPVSKTVKEGETLKLANVAAPPVVVDAFCSALGKAQGKAKLALVRLLGSTGSHKALEIVCAAAREEGPVKETAQRTLCDWPTPDAVTALMEMAKASPDATVKVLALRGAVRLIGQSDAAPAQLCAQYAALMDHAGAADEKKAVLGGLAQVPHSDALALVFRQFKDDAVKAEAVQAAIEIAKSLGKSASEDKTIFNGKDMTGWTGDAKLWRCVEGALVGHNNEPLSRNEFLWAAPEVRDFYMVVDIKLEPNSGNGGVQFRSKKIDEHGQALGYQADVGQDVWGRLYHEHGRGKLDWNARAEKAVKPGQWNHYEILAVGPGIWTAINGNLGVAYLDTDQNAERSGMIALQLHAGPPQTISYKVVKLVHDPKLEMEGLTAENLINKLGK